MPSNRSVRYIDFGYTSAREYWDEIGVPAHQRFLAAQNRQEAIGASFPAWHVHERVWHESNPGSETQGNISYYAFRDRLTKECPELAWVRDIADAGKHRGLGRPGHVRRVSMGESSLLTRRDGSYVTLRDGSRLTLRAGLEIELTDGASHLVATVLNIVAAFWQKHFDAA